MSTILITGGSSGLGKELVSLYAADGATVINVSRSANPDADENIVCDFSHPLEHVMRTRLAHVQELDYVFLNAGTVGPIKKVCDVTEQDIIDFMRINLFASKRILDELLQNDAKIKNVVAVSSGAANKGYDGWVLYCMAKASLKQLIHCYALEHPDTNFLSLSPGPVKTKMQAYLQTLNSDTFSSLKKFHALYDNMPEPSDVARVIFEQVSNIIYNTPNGSFFDLRDLHDT